MSTENLVMKAGWFASRYYANDADVKATEFDATGKFFKIRVGGFRPKFEINSKAWKADKTAAYKCFVDTTVIFKEGDVEVEPYVRLYVPEVSALTDIRFKVFLME